MYKKSAFRLGVPLVVTLAVLLAAGCGVAGAADWTSETTPTDDNLNDVVHASDGAYAVGDEGYLLNRTEDGDWQVVLEDGPEGDSNDLRGIGVTDDGNAVWFVGVSGAIGEYDVTTDTTTDHSDTDEGVTNNFNDVAVTGDAGDGSVYIVDDAGEIHHTFNNGDEWDTGNEPGGGDALTGVDFHDERAGHAVDENQNVFATDDGETWNDIGIQDTSLSFTDVDSNAEDDVWVSTDTETVFSYDGTDWEDEDVSGDSQTLNGIVICPCEGDTGFAVGDGGGVFHLDEGTWDEGNTDTGNNLQGVTESGPHIAVGDNGTAILREWANLRVNEFGDEFPDAEPPHDYGEVEIPVEETNGVETEGLEVSLEITGDDAGTVFSETDDTATLEGEEADFVFDVGSLTEADSYEATVTADADNADVATGEESFEVEDDGEGPNGDDDEPEFVVTVDDTNSPVVEGDSLSVDATVVNQGNEDGSQTVDLELDGEMRDVTSEQLDAGEETEVTFEWVTTEGDAGSYTALVSSEDTADHAQVTVETMGATSVGGASGLGYKPPTFDEKTEASLTTNEPDEVDVGVEVMNTGIRRGSTKVQLIGGGEVVDEDYVSDLPGYMSEKVELSTNPENERYEVVVTNGSADSVAIGEGLLNETDRNMNMEEMDVYAGTEDETDDSGDEIEVELISSEISKIIPGLIAEAIAVM